MESWRSCWRRGIAPQLSTSGLEALRKGLIDDDPKLLQGATTSPPPLQCVEDWPCERACPLGYPAMQTGSVTVRQVERAFSRLCEGAEKTMKEVAPARQLITWWDNTPRQTARVELLAEVNRSLAERAADVAT